MMETMETVQTSAPFTEQQLLQAGFDRNSTIDLMKVELNAFAMIVIPDVFVFMFPEIHNQIWNLLATAVGRPGTFEKFCLGLPRGHAKTTLIKLFVCYCVLFTDRKFVLLIGAASRMSEGVLGDITSMLRGENVRKIFGDLIFSKDTEQVKRFTFAGRHVILAALGAGSSLRGLNLDNDRPDIIICDDIQSAEDRDNENTAKNLLIWMLGTLFKAKSPTGCLYIYIGNKFPGPNCILTKLQKSTEWISFVVGALLADGTSIWPQLHSPESLIADLQHDMDMGHPEVWFAEVQNDPDAGITSDFDVSKVPQYPFDEHDLMTAGFIVIDLAGEKEGANDTVIGHFCTIEQKQVYNDLDADVYSPLQCIEAAMKMAFKWNCPHIFVESVAYQASYKFWFDFICRQRGISGFQLHEIYPKGIKKVTRIVRFLKSLLSGDILLNPRVRTQILYQATQFKPSVKNNTDDILDVGGYHDLVMTDYGPMLQLPVMEVLAKLLGGAKTMEDCSSI